MAMLNNQRVYIYIHISLWVCLKMDYPPNAAGFIKNTMSHKWI